MRTARNAHPPDSDALNGQRLRVLIDAVAVQAGGGGTFVVSQLTALACKPELHLTVYAAGAVASELERVPRLRVRRPPRGGLVKRLLWEHAVLARRSRGFDVLYCTGNFALPLASIPQVVTMQNALHFGAAARRFRRECTWSRRSRMSAEAWLARMSVRRSQAVVAVSESLREAIYEDSGVRSWVRTVPSATPVLPSPRMSVELRPYILAVAHDHPHKDWDALATLFGRESDLPPLVAVGWFTAQRRRQLLTRVPAGRMRFRGVVEDRAQLAALYANAACCIVHSHVESFGLTALEALSAGVAVVASDIPAHREICGDRAGLYDPVDMQSLSRQLRAALRRPPPGTGGAKRLSWTWDDNATELAAVLQQAAAVRPIQ